MAGREHQAGLSSILTLLLTAALSAGQKLNAVESNGVFFSGLPRPPSEINAITAKGSDAFGNTLGRGLLEKFTTPNPLKIGSTPFDFRFNSAKPDNRFAVTGGRTPSVLVTRPPFFTGNPTSPTTAPRFAAPTSSQGTGSTAGQSTPFFPINSSPPSQRSQGTGATAEQPTPFFPINSSPPSQRSQGTGSSAGQPTPFFPANSSPPSQRAQSPVATTRPPAPFFPINTTPAPHPAAERSFNAINTARTTFPVPTPPRRRIFVPASALNTGTSFTTTTARPQTRFATLTFGTEFSTFRPATRTTTPPPTVTGFTGTGSNLNFAFCDQRQCVKMCRERFGDRLNSSSCQANACKCEVTEACSPSLCLQMCRKNNPGQQVISAGCQGDNCRCVFNKPCEPSECRRRCLLAHGDKLISADCAVRNACQCVHS
ncbi:uncharacterized protein LOC144099447 isoform X5 [Amblyomma americanum]